jgi:amino acid adenylation domain-containing protein
LLPPPPPPPSSPPPPPPAPPPPAGALERLPEQLARWLPGHMVPAAWVGLDEIPLTGNGKVDRKALPDPAPPAGAGAGGRRRPSSPVEEMLAGIWEEVLGVPRVGPEDDFFWLGGHSLLATRVASRIRRAFGVDLPLPEIFEAPVLAAQAARVAARLGVPVDDGPVLAAAPAGEAGAAALSFAQRRLWFLQRLDPAGAAYNMPGAADLAGPLEPRALHAALQRVVDRQGSLRTALETRGGEPVAVVHAAVPVRLPRVDLAALAGGRRRREAARLEAREARRPFDLAAAPLMRALLLAAGDEGGAARHTLVLVLHHLVADGGSVDVLVRELAAAYAAAAAPAAGDAGLPELPELRLQYTDYADWQRRWLAHGAGERQLAWWRGRLTGAPRRLELPTDRPRPAEQCLRGADLGLRLDGALAAALAALGRRHGATLFMTLLAGFQILLARYSGQADIVVGAPAANRDRLETEPLIGLFVNLLPMRAELAGSRSFVEVLARVRQGALGAYLHRDVPFEMLVDELAGERSLSHSPLFQAAMALEEQPPPAVRAGGVEMRTRALDSGTAKFDLTLELARGEDGLAGRLEYATALFDATTVERMADHLRRLLTAMAAEPESSPWRASLLGPEERRQLVADWGRVGASAADAAEPLPARVLRAAAAYPGAPAVVAGGAVLTYGELDRRSAALARRLAARGAGIESVVGVCLPPSAELVVAALAALRAGAAFLPLDPVHPADRLGWSLRDAGAELVLTSAELAAGALAQAGVEAWTVDAADAVDAAGGGAAVLDAPPATPDQLAYVIYTSGTTGRPKGTGLTHRGLARLVAWHGAAYGLTAADRGTLVASPAFDASVWELWPYLAAGAAIHVPAPELRLDPAALYRWLADSGITVGFLPTPMAEAMLDGQPPAGLALRALLVGGDRLHAPPRRGLPFRVVNHYGPTEDTVVSTAGEVAPDTAAAAPSIGGPIDGHQALVLDVCQEPVPAGVEGELWVAGEGLARGYRGRPALTAERFRPHPCATVHGARAYRTGDLVRWRAGGRLDFRGRADHQVKVRGHRIELGEVEAALLRQPGVEQAAVVVRDDLGSAQLVAFVTGARTAAAADGLRAALEATLPAYMVPAFIHRLDALPLTSNGKADRDELTRLGRELAAPAAADGGRVAPRGDAERLLAGIWEEVLGVERVGAGDDFFALGGDSILSIKIIARAREAGLELTPQQLFQHPTVARLAAAAGGDGGPAGDGAAAAGDAPGAGYPRVRITARQLDRLREARAGRAPVEDLLPLTPLQQGMLFHVLDAPGSGLYVHQQSCLLEGGLDPDAFAAAFRGAVDRHPILRASVVAGVADEPIQVIARQAPLPWTYRDWRGVPAEEQRARTEALFRADRDAGFELSREPLMRCSLVRLGDDRFHFAWTFHLMLLDGWSTPLVLDDVLTLYRGLRRGVAAELPPPVPFSRYVDWLARQDHAAAEVYWRRLLAGFTEPTPLGDRPRDDAAHPHHGERTLELDAGESRALSAFAARHRLTLNTVFQGVWALHLAQRSAADDVVFGNVVAGRPADLPGVESIVGIFLNTVPVRASVSGDATMVEWLAALQAQQAEARRFAYASQADVRRWSGVPAGSPLYDSILIFQNVPAGPSFDPGDRWDVRVRDVRSVERNNFPLTVAVEPGERLLLRFVYDTGRFGEPTVARMMDAVRRLLVETVEQPARRLSDFSRGSQVESRHLIQGFNQDLELR